jgi:nitrate reductase assembly molybdenum cofactor insertion protein NarJ
MITMAEQGLYGKFANLFVYPWNELGSAIEECQKALLDCPEYSEDAKVELDKFAEEVGKMSLDDVQGIYSYTFEISAGDFALDLGYHLYEGFKRANNLLSLKEMYKANNFPYEAVSKGELPDNLPVVLKFIDSVKEDLMIKSLREDFLIKALEKLNKNFENKQDSPYAHLLKSLLIIINTDVKGPKEEEAENA